MKHAVEPIILILVGLIVLFAFLLMAEAQWMKNDGQTFQVLAGCLGVLVTTFVGYVKPRKPEPPPDPPTALGGR